MNIKFDKALIFDAISAFARFFLAFIWIKAGVAKINVHLSVFQSIKAYEIFTDEWANYLAYLIGPLEIAGGLLLLLGLFLRKSSVVSAIVLVLFMIGISQSWARGLQIDCGCFKVDAVSDPQVMNYVHTLLRDTVFLFLTGWLYFRPFRKFAIYP